MSNLITPADISKKHRTARYNTDTPVERAGYTVLKVTMAWPFITVQRDGLQLLRFRNRLSPVSR